MVQGAGADPAGRSHPPHRRRGSDYRGHGRAVARPVRGRSLTTSWPAATSHAPIYYPRAPLTG